MKHATMHGYGIHVATCEECGARIIWAEIFDGLKKPFEPNPQGSAIIRDGVLLVGASAHDLRDGEELLMPHWPTCPESKRFKR